jgi:hypothetical protein
LIKASWVSLAQAFSKAEKLKNPTEPKAVTAIKIDKTSVDYIRTTANRGIQKGQARGQGGRGNNAQNQSRSKN